MMIQTVDRLNTASANYKKVKSSKTSSFCKKAGKGLYRSLIAEADFVLNTV